MPNLIDYERENNELLQDICKNETLVNTIIENNAILLVPTEASLKQCKYRSSSQLFAECHVLILNSKDPFQFISLTGIRGVFSDGYDLANILAGPPKGDEKMKFFSNANCLFESEIFESSEEPLQKIHILRQSEIPLLHLTPHDEDHHPINNTVAKSARIFLISEPIDISLFESELFGTSFSNLNENNLSENDHNSSNHYSNHNSHNVNFNDENESQIQHSYSDNFSSSFSQKLHLRGLFDIFSSSTFSSNNNDNNDNNSNEDDENNENNSNDLLSSSSSEMKPMNEIRYSKSTSDINSLPIQHQHKKYDSNYLHSKNNNNENYSNNNNIDNIDNNNNNNNNENRLNKESAQQISNEYNSGTFHPVQRKGNFHQFIDKMKQPKAANLKMSIRKIIESVEKDEYPTSDLPSYIRAFLDETNAVIQKHPLWRNSAPEELEEAHENLEKYLLSKIYDKAFCPTFEDIKEDENLRMKLNSLQFLQPKHLDIDSRISKDTLWPDALEEIKRMNSFKSPREKLVCISNCSKIVFNIIQRKYSGPASADHFLPVLIYLILKANPRHLHSNLKFIEGYRSPDQLISETGYLFTHVQSAVYFWKSADETSFSINPQEYRKLKKGDVFSDDFSENDQESSDSIFLRSTTLINSEKNKNLYNNNNNNKKPELIDYQSQEKLIELFKNNDFNDRYGFSELNPGDLKIGDVSVLLKEYQRLTNIIHQTKYILEEQNHHSCHYSSPSSPSSK